MGTKKIARIARRTRLLGAAFPPFSRSLLKIAAAASVAGLAPALAGPSLPAGGSVTSGSATIGTPQNGSLTINQSSDKAIINWQGFSVGQGNGVTFNNGSGATLNRVTGTAQSNIDGSLTATGSVFLLNPHGVVIGPTGVVNVGKNFVASTLGTSDDAFNAGGSLTLSGTSNGAVVNEGKIGSLGGDVALIARNVANTGAISAPKGSAGLLAGTQVTVRDSTLDDGKFSVDLGTSSDSARNTGNIAAAEAELKANGGNVYAVGGAVGYNTTAATLNDVYATGTVDGAAPVLGGLIGYNRGSVTNAYSTGSVGIATTHIAGGLVGYNTGMLTDVYTASPMAGAATIGAIVGFNAATGVLTNADFDILVTGALKGFGANLNHATTAGELGAPATQSDYDNFDFINHWTIQPGQTPTLQHAP